MKQLRQIERAKGFYVNELGEVYKFANGWYKLACLMKVSAYLFVPTIGKLIHFT